MSRNEIIKHKCTTCNKEFVGSLEEIREIFVNHKGKPTNLCRTCKNEYYQTQKFLKGVGSRVSVEELIEVLDLEGYPLKKEDLDLFLEESYIDCDISKKEWLNWIKKDFYNHKSIQDILNFNYKKCNTCNKWLPHNNFYNKIVYSSKNKKYSYKRSDCKKCASDIKKEYFKNNKDSVKKHSFKYTLKKYLLKNNYIFNDEQLNILTDYKFKEDIRSKKVLILKHGTGLCLKKI